MANNYGGAGASAVAAATTGVGEERSILRFELGLKAATITVPMRSALT